MDLTLLEETTAKMINELFEDKKDVIKEIESIIKDNLNITDYDALSLEIKLYLIQH